MVFLGKRDVSATTFFVFFALEVLPAVDLRLFSFCFFGTFSSSPDPLARSTDSHSCFTLFPLRKLVILVWILCSVTLHGQHAGGFDIIVATACLVVSGNWLQDFPFSIHRLEKDLKHASRCARTNLACGVSCLWLRPAQPNGMFTLQINTGYDSWKINVNITLMERYNCVMETDKTNETLHR